jgi:hypothetical protein
MKPHDQFAKNYLEQLLSPLGIVEISKEVSDETRQIDLFFSPNPEPNPNYLGLWLFGLCYAMDGGYKGWNPYIERHLAIFVNCFCSRAN